jgi:hypothetical protein
MVDYETLSPEARFSRIFLDPLNTSFPDTLPSPARVQTATILFVPE